MTNETEKPRADQAQAETQPKATKTTLLSTRTVLIACGMLCALMVCDFGMQRQHGSKAAAYGLTSIQSIAPTVRCDICYATPNNFTGKVVYENFKGICYLATPTARKVSQVQRELKKQGLGLLVWDGYRPISGQWCLWNAFPVPGYVADPRKGGKHTRGTAVDCTIVNLATGQPLEMPTGFDDLTEKAGRTYDNISAEAKKNRALLQTVMEKHGFIGLPTEWWHFDMQGWQDFPPLDVDFDALA